MNVTKGSVTERNVKSGNNIFWGVVFIAAAVLIIIDAVGIGPDLPFVKIAFGVLFLAWAVKEMLKLNFSGVFFPLAFTFMIFEKEIASYIGTDENIISNWLVLLAALLLTIGTNMIFGNMRISFSRKGHIAASPTHKNRFSEVVKYIDCADFQHAYVKNTFGEYNIYFQNTEAYEGGATLQVSNLFGEMDIHVPADWNVVFDVTNNFGEAHTTGSGNPEGKTLKITGQNKFGELGVFVE